MRASLNAYTQQPACIVFTSSKAVEAVAANLETHPMHWNFFCIGHGTRTTVHKYFGGSSITATADNASQLAKEIIGRGITHDVLFFCGDQRRDELPDMLSAAGIRATEIVTYETILTPEKIVRQYDGILFFSPSAVQSFFSMNAVQPQTMLFSIGSTTAVGLKNNIPSYCRTIFSGVSIVS